MSKDEALRQVREQFGACPSSFHEAKRWLERRMDGLCVDDVESDHRSSWWSLYMGYFNAWTLLTKAQVQTPEMEAKAD